MEPTVAPPREKSAGTTLAARFAAFVTERFPFALDRAIDAFGAVCREEPGRDPAAIDRLRGPLAEALARRIDGEAPRGIPDPTPRVTAADRLRHARAELLDACDGFLRREAIAASLTRDERVEILRGM